MRSWNQSAFRVLSILALVGCQGCQEKSACIKNGVRVDVAGNHGHEVSVPTERVRGGVAGMYALRGGSHEHALLLTDADMKALHDGKPVTTRSSAVQGHVHEIGVTCKE